MTAGWCLTVALALVQPAPAVEGKIYGKGVAAKSPVTVETLLASPEQYLGKTVRVDDLVHAVDAGLGTWLDLGGESGDRGLRVSAPEGVIVFPMRLVGRKVSAEGVFEELPLSEMEIAAFRIANAPPTPAAASVPPPAPVKPPKAYRLRATGAVAY
jgi:hypothetical protein